MTPIQRRAYKRALKMARCQQANTVLQIISDHGRRFFHYKERVAEFEVDERGHIWFIDEYSQKRIWTHYPHRWKNFSGGGTLLSLCKALRDFIQTGEPIRAGWFGPWPQHYCDGDLWGYGPDMEIVRERVKTTGAVAV